MTRKEGRREEERAVHKEKERGTDMREREGGREGVREEESEGGGEGGKEGGRERGGGGGEGRDFRMMHRIVDNYSTMYIC